MASHLIGIMAMAMAMRRAGRAGAFMRGKDWCGNGATGVRFMASAATRVDDEGSSSSSVCALGAFSALLGAGALFSACQQTVLFCVEFSVFSLLLWHFFLSGINMFLEP